ncbi:MAG: DNA translocase FtsK 4TM domain-containing protein [Candidatus Paceibacterota bacterium]
MAKKNKEENSKKKTGWSKHLKEETIQGIITIIFFVLGVLLILAAFGKAGFVGAKIYDWLTEFLGFGYFLLPAVLFILGVSFWRSLEQSFPITKIIGSIIFFLSGLGIIGLVAEKGGKLGEWIASPLINFFDIYASIVFLGALFIISLLVIFETRLTANPLILLWQKLFGAKKKPHAIKIEGEFNEEDEDMKENADDETSEEENQTAKDNPEIKPKAIPFVVAKKEEDEFIKGGQDFGAQLQRLGIAFEPPPLSLLEKDKGKPEVGDIKAKANIIKRTLQNFGIDVEMDEISIGPSVTRYALKPAEGVKLSKIVALQNDLALALAAHPIRIEAPIPGKSLVGIEIPNSTKSIVGLATLLGNSEFQDSAKPLLVSLGKSISGKSHFANLAKMPHMLIAGTTGSGKSVTIHTIITSLLFRNPTENLRFIMIDPKRVELTLYNKIPHLLTPVITEAKKAILSLKWAAKEMDRRYDILEAESVRDIESYHKNILEPEIKKLEKARLDGEPEETLKLPDLMPYIVIVIDELADIMSTYPRELEAAIVRLAQMSRAVGIHLILSTQRPSVNVITGLIKANIPARIALQVSSQIDSRTILDTGGAEKLLGAGDMLFLSGEMSKPLRIQSAFISEGEVKKVVKYLIEKHQDDVPSEINLTGEVVAEKNPIFDSTVDDVEEIDDDLYEQAREEVIKAGKASTSYLQRKLRIGYSRAARLIDLLEQKGVVGRGEGSKPREVMGAPSAQVEKVEGVIAEEANQEELNNL